MSGSATKYFQKYRPVVEKELDRILPLVSLQPSVIHEAMRYSVLGGGKRLRAILVMAGAEICGGRAADVVSFACALELIHAYSLIHDDLPAMDNDDMRRGKLTNHKVFGDDIAILAGDALLTLAFEIMSEPSSISPRARLAALRKVAGAAGTIGMVGGQVADIQADKGRWKKPFPGGFRTANELLEFIHHHKTGSLIRASLSAGGILAGGSLKQIQALEEYGRCIGLLFQITDDILDVTADKTKLGKRGSDADNEKLTYVTLYGLIKAQQEAKQLVFTAQKALKIFGKKAQMLNTLAAFIFKRDF